MNKKRLTPVAQGLAMAMAIGTAPMAMAVDWSVSGFIRQEMAYKLGGGDENYWNQQGNLYNGKPTPNAVHALVGIEPVEITRPDSFSEDNDWNLFNTRGELDIEARLTDDFKFYSKIRALYAWDDMWDAPGDADTNFFETPIRDDCATRLEVCGEDYMIDLPSFYLDYTKGPFWLRAGNQQIAWGESIFFRVLDVPNGIDQRRHSVLDWASEEYSDKRVSGLGLRGSYRFRNDWELEAFAQEFQPSIYNNENTPYNVVASQFVVQQEERFDEVDDKWNFGARLRGQIGELGLQFMAVSRRNPDGIFRWTTSKVNPFVKLGLPDAVLDSELPGFGGASYRQVGDLLSQTPFEPFTGQGVYTAQEWMNYAGRSRLDGVDGVQATIDDFPASAAVAAPVLAAFGIDRIDTYEEATLVLDSFFSAPAGGLGDLRGHIERYYPQEEIFGFGLNYMFFSEPDSLLDQLVVRFEATYTPDKKFSDPALRRKAIEEDEWVTGLVFEKYQRFSQEFPATFMVFQWMHKSESDMFGRHLDGYEGDTFNAPPRGRDSFDAIAFALQQPFPSLIWRADLAILWDPEGGYLIQPGVRWKPSEAFTVEGFVNIVDGEDDNTDMMGTLDWSDEVTLRLTYQF